MKYYRAIDEKILLTPKLLYFFLSIQVYADWDLHRIMFIHHTFNRITEDFGYQNGLLLLLAFFTGILMAQIADKLQQPKVILIISLILSASYYALFMQDLIPLNMDSAFVIYPFFLITSNVLFPLFDGICLDYLKNTLKLNPAVYGRQRLWANVGYIVTQCIAVVVYDPTYDRFEGIAAILRIVVTIILVPMVLFLIQIPKLPVVLKIADISILKLLEREYIFFLWFILLNGLTATYLTMYLDLYYTELWWNVRVRKPWFNELFPYKEVGFWGSIDFFLVRNAEVICVVSALISEIVIFSISTNIIHKFGLLVPLICAQVAQAFRFLAYAFVGKKTPGKLYLCFAIELLTGINFALTHASGVQLAMGLVPPQLKATAQIVYYRGIFTGVGAFLGGCLGYLFMPNGYIEEKFSTNFFLVGFGIICLNIVLFVVKYWVYDEYFHHRNPTEEVLEM